MIENTLKSNIKSKPLVYVNKKSFNNKLSILKLYYKTKYKLYRTNIIKHIVNNTISKINHLYVNKLFNAANDKSLLEYLSQLTINNIQKTHIINRLKYILLKKILKYRTSVVKKTSKRNRRYNNRNRSRYKKKEPFIYIPSYALKNYQKKLNKNNFLKNFGRFNEFKLRYYMGVIYVLLTHNNTFINVKTNKVNVLRWMTSGSYGYKNSQKSSFFAAENVALKFGRLVKYGYKINNIIVKIKGYRGSRRNIIKGLKKSKLSIFKFEDITPFAHNGCRKKKKRRL